MTVTATVRHRGPKWVAVAAASYAVVMTIVMLVVLAAREHPWHPLGPYPDQKVISDETVIYRGEPIPLVHLDAGEVTVVGTKCYKEAVTVSGRSTWTSVDPPGFALLVGEGSRDVKQGCVEQTFNNNIPPTVAEFVRVRAPQPPVGFVVMRFVGTEVAREGDRVSEPLTWRTEQFAIAP